MARKPAAQVALARKAAKLKAESKVKHGRPVGTNVPTVKNLPVESPPTPISSAPQQPRAPPPKKFLIDKRAEHVLAAMPPGDDDQLFTVSEAALLLAVSVQWLDLLRKNGGGPEFQKLGPRLIRYRRGTLRAWVIERGHMRTAEYT
jgi:predicted DNA-binding transcriptional regulator AlpA